MSCAQPIENWVVPASQLKSIEPCPLPGRKTFPAPPSPEFIERQSFTTQYVLIPQGLGVQESSPLDMELLEI